MQATKRFYTVIKVLICAVLLVLSSFYIKRVIR